MDKIIFEMPVGVAMKFAGWNTSDMDVVGNINFSGQFSDVFIIFKISPKFNFGAGFSG